MHPKSGGLTTTSSKDKQPETVTGSGSGKNVKGKGKGSSSNAAVESKASTSSAINIPAPGSSVAGSDINMASPSASGTGGADSQASYESVYTDEEEKLSECVEPTFRGLSFIRWLASHWKEVAARTLELIQFWGAPLQLRSWWIPSCDGRRGEASCTSS